MTSVLDRADSVTFVGLDVHKDSISAAVLPPGREVPQVRRIVHDEESVRRLVAVRRAEGRVAQEAVPAAAIAEWAATIGRPLVDRRSAGSSSWTT